MDQQSQQSIIRKTFPVGPLQCNCTILGNPLTKEGIVIDPGGDAELIINEILNLKLKIVSIIHTHAHLDHFLASGEIKKLTGAPIYLHKEDRFLWDNLEMQCNLFGIPYKPAPDPDFYLQDDDTLDCCGLAMHTPGHTPGSMSFWFQEHKLLIAGDTLFRRSIGRTDLWGGDFKTIEKSIKERIFTLDEEAIIVTGHGPDTTVAEEIRENPFVKPK